MKLSDNLAHASMACKGITLYQITLRHRIATYQSTRQHTYLYTITDGVITQKRWTVISLKSLKFVEEINLKWNWGCDDGSACLVGRLWAWRQRNSGSIPWQRYGSGVHPASNHQDDTGQQSNIHNTSPTEIRNHDHNVCAHSRCSHKYNRFLAGTQVQRKQSYATVSLTMNCHCKLRYSSALVSFL